jgi:hypothetical protein
VLKVLNERDEDHRIYLHLTAQLEAAFYKATRYVASSSLRHGGRGGGFFPLGDAALLASEGGLSGVDALAAKLGKLKALKIANVLHMNVKKVVPITPFLFFPPSALWLIGIFADPRLVRRCASRISLRTAKSKRCWRQHERGMRTRFANCGCGVSSTNSMFTMPRMVALSPFLPSPSYQLKSSCVSCVSCVSFACVMQAKIRHCKSLLASGLRFCSCVTGL